MDIIVTTPKSEIENAAREAEDVKRAGGGMYFRRFPLSQRPDVLEGDRVYYVDDGYVRGFCVVDKVHEQYELQQCCITGRLWGTGFYVHMDARTWQWIAPIPMRGFQGFRYAHPEDHVWDGREIKIVGGWMDPKPEVKS